MQAAAYVSLTVLCVSGVLGRLDLGAREVMNLPILQLIMIKVYFSQTWRLQNLPFSLTLAYNEASAFSRYWEIHCNWKPHLQHSTHFITKFLFLYNLLKDRSCSSRGSGALFWPLWVLHTCGSHTYT